MFTKPFYRQVFFEMKIQLLHLWTTRQNEEDWSSRFLAPILLQPKSLFNRKCRFECDITDVSVGAFSPKSITMHNGTWLKTVSGHTKRTYYLMELESTAAGKASFRWSIIQGLHSSRSKFSFLHPAHLQVFLSLPGGSPLMVIIRPSASLWDSINTGRGKGGLQLSLWKIMQ